MRTLSNGVAIPIPSIEGRNPRLHFLRIQANLSVAIPIPSIEGRNWYASKLRNSPGGKCRNTYSFNRRS